MNTDQSKPPILEDKALFHQYWKRFVPLWIFPLVFMGAMLIEDFVGFGLLRNAAVIISGIVFFAGLAYSSAPYRRREISGSQMMKLSTPWLGIWFLLVIIRGIVFTLIGKPL